MDRMEEVRAKHFGRFLLQHRLLDKWFENLIEQHGKHETRGIPQYREDGDFLKLLHKCKNIDHSFCWANTPQGHNFWSQKNEEEKTSWEKTKKDMQIMKGSLYTTFYAKSSTFKEEYPF